MPAFRQADPSASEAIAGRLDRLIGDPLRQELRDPQFMDFVSRQFDRAFPGPVRRDSTGRQRDSLPEIDDLEPFRPAVARGDLELSAGVGPRQKNRLTDLVGVKKALAKTGFLDFDVTEEPSDKAGPLFQAALGRFQRDHGLKVDAVVEPGGPTVKALRKAVFKDEDGERERATERSGETTERQRASGDNDNAARPQLAQSSTTPEPDVVWPQSTITNEFRMEISDEESDHRYHVRELRGGRALGRYQLQPLFLVDAGFKKINTSGQIVWDPSSGITSDQDFLNNPRAQEEAFAKGMLAKQRQLSRNGSMDRVGIDIDGESGKFTVSEAGLIAAAHRQGAKRVRQYLEWQEANGLKADVSTIPQKERREQFDTIEKRLLTFQAIQFAK